MGRITRPQMFMEMARAASRRSTCFRLNVGALVCFENSPVAVGWNGAPAGEPHCTGNVCPGITPGGCPTIHAEVNALNRAERIMNHGSAVDLYVTHSPCKACTEKIMASGLTVRKIFFEVPYRSTDHLEQLNHYKKTSSRYYWQTGVYEVNPAGYTVDYFTRQVLELP